RRRHTRSKRDWSSDVCSSDLEGDIVITESISRFARNTKDLLELIEILEAKKVSFISKKEAIDTTTPTGKFMLTVFGAMAELERRSEERRVGKRVDIGGGGKSR